MVTLNGISVAVEAWTSGIAATKLFMGVQRSDVHGLQLEGRGEAGAQSCGTKSHCLTGAKIEFVHLPH